MSWASQALRQSALKMLGARLNQRTAVLAASFAPRQHHRRSIHSLNQFDGRNTEPYEHLRGRSLLRPEPYASPLIFYSTGQSEAGVEYPDVPPLIISPSPCRVVVIGWMGSRARYLRKYTSLWQASGDHEVLGIRPSVAQTLLRFKGVVAAGRDIDAVARLHIENPALPTFYHIFSTGGFVHAGTMWRWMDEVEDVMLRRDLLEEVAGIILDSAPSRVDEDIAARAVMSVLSNQPALPPGAGEGPVLGAARNVLRLWFNSSSIKKREEEVYEAWYNRAPYCPQLYLYSEGDPLVPPSHVEQYMKVQESRGVEVSSYKWRDSGHCEHFRRYPHEYAFQISTFISKALKNWS